MFKKLSLEKKIKIKSKFTQITIFVMAIIAAFELAGFGGFSPLTNVIIIAIICVIGIVVIEFLQQWIGNTISEPIYNAVIHTNSASSEIIDATTKQENIIHKHLQMLKEASSVIEKLSISSQQTKVTAEKVAKKSHEIIHMSGKEQEAVNANIEKMRTLKQKIEIIAELTLELSEHTQQIGSIIGVVEDITEQTNMLALNAAVEAARAGEHGKGFAVVASEIRKLADESKQATSKISSLIHDIQQATNSTVMATEEGTKEIESGVDLAQQIAQSIDELKSTINEAVTSIEEVLNAANQQSSHTCEVSDVINSINQGMLDSAVNIKQNLVILNGLISISKSLQEKVVGNIPYLREDSDYKRAQ
jgi:methyl-accepting chemotaxis protein